MPPGPELACILTSIDRAQLNGHDLVILMQAPAKQIAHEQAEFYANPRQGGGCDDRVLAPTPGPAGSGTSMPLRDPLENRDLGVKHPLTRVNPYHF
jgi:hypothetical protein